MTTTYITRPLSERATLYALGWEIVTTASWVWGSRQETVVIAKHDDSSFSYELPPPPARTACRWTNNTWRRN